MTSRPCRSAARRLVDRLLQQIKPFNPQLHLAQEVAQFSRREDGRFAIATAAGTRFDAGAVVIAAGVGSFQARRIGIEGAGPSRAKLLYRVKDASALEGKRLVVFGGGDSALDWTLELAPRPRSVTLVHRRREFRAAPASVAKMQDLARGRPRALLRGAAPFAHRRRMARFRASTSRCGRHGARAGGGPPARLLRPAPETRPDRRWGLELERKHLKVDTEKFQTNVPGVFAVGDINTYPGKKKLILSGFHEAALAAFAIQHHLFPQKKQFLQYTTTSPIMHQRLGVPDHRFAGDFEPDQ